MTAVQPKTGKKTHYDKNLRFKVSAIVEGREAILSELPKTYAYRNNLAAIERQRRREEESVLREEVEGLSALADAHHASQKAIDDVWQEYKERNRKARTKTDRSDIDERLVPLKKIRKEAATAYFTALKKAWTSISSTQKLVDAKVAELLPGRVPEKANTRTIQQLEQVITDEVLAEPVEGADPKMQRLLRRLRETRVRAWGAARAARDVCGMYWGTYIMVEAAADAFRKDFGDPQDRFYRGEGRVGTQLQKGLPVEDAFACTDTRLRLQHDPRPHISETDPKYAHVPKPTPGSKSNERRKREDYLVYLRVGSVSGTKKPLWAVLRVWLSPERLPPGSRITFASLHRKILAGRERWYLRLQTALPVKPPVATPEKAVGIDVGYRVKEDGSMRVAVAAGSDGVVHELTLDAGYIREFSKVFDLQSLRDTAYNDIRQRFRMWLDNDPNNKFLIPVNLLEAAGKMDEWYSPGPLASLVRAWGKSRGSQPTAGADQALFLALDEWRKRDYHLWQYQENLRDQLQANRTDRYRVFAKRMRERYGEIVVERLNLNELHDVTRPEEERKLPKQIRSAARLACLSDLLKFLRESGAVEHPPENTTKFHLNCEQVIEAEFAKHYVVHCQKCGEDFDQDVNAAKVLLAGAGTDRVQRKPDKKPAKDGTTRLTRKEARAAKIAERQKLAGRSEA
jgi:hypothetical protein